MDRKVFEMRILVDGMPRTKGGIGSLILNIAEYARNYCKNDDLTFDFIIAGRSGYLPFLEENGYRYYMAPPVSEVKKYQQFLRSLFAGSKYDFLWFNNTSKVNLMLPTYAKKQGVKLITHPHGVDMEEKGMKRIVFKALDRLNEGKMFSLIDVPFACSEEAADVYYRGSASLREKTVIIRNGINTDAFSFDPVRRKKVRDELGVKDGEILLGAVGRLTAVKNYPFLIELLRRLDEKYKMIILGEGEDKTLLEELIRENGLSDRCFLLGSKENVRDYLSAMDVFLMPSLNEGMPYSIIEAQCAGLPCVVSDTLSPNMKITDLVAFVSLDDPQAWITSIVEGSRSADRKQYKEKVIASGYGIEQTYSAFKRAIGVED